MKALVPAGLGALLGAVPEGVELVELAPDGPLPAGAEEVEFVVLAPELWPRVDELLALPALRVLQTLSAGVDTLPERLPPGVTLCNAGGVYDAPVADWVLAVVLAWVRGLPLWAERQRERRWDPDPGDGTIVDEVDGMLVVVLGHGSIGRAVEARLRPFGARVVGIARQARTGVQGPEALDRLLPEAAVVVDLLPLTPATERFVDARFFARMRDGALLVNAGRGATVDTAALERELRAGRLRAALDVTDPEPLPPEHSLWSAPNLLLTPHVAGASSRAPGRAHALVADQLRRHAAGETLLNVRADY